MSNLTILQREFSSWQNYNYLVYELKNKTAVMIDASQNSEQLFAESKNLGLEVSRILITHSHFDHVQGLKQILNLQPKIKICIHEAEADALNWLGKNLEILKSDQKIYLGEKNILVLHTPGHSPGSVCYFTDKAVFTGDTVFINGHGRTDLPGSDHEALKQSFEKFKSFPENLVLYPGHAYSEKKCSTLGKEKNNLS